jgi:hypothetical protein
MGTLTVAGKSDRPKRAIHNLARVLDVATLARAGLFVDGDSVVTRTEFVRILGTSKSMESKFAWITARLSGSGGVLQVHDDYPGHIAVTTRVVKIPPFVHWLLICPGCPKPRRRLFWVGGPWHCRECARLTYRDSRQWTTAPLDPENIDLVDFSKLRRRYRFNMEEVVPVLKKQAAKVRRTKQQKIRRAWRSLSEADPDLALALVEAKRKMDDTRLMP